MHVPSYTSQGSPPTRYYKPDNKTIGDYSSYKPMPDYLSMSPDEFGPDPGFSHGGLFYNREQNPRPNSYHSPFGMPNPNPSSDNPLPWMRVKSQDAFQVIKEADRAGTYAPNGGQEADGKLTRSELSNYTNKLKQQTSFIRAISQFFPGIAQNDFIKGMFNKLDAAQFMQNNFDSLAYPERSGAEPIMSAFDLLPIVGADGNRNDLSLQDIDNMRFR